MSDQAPKLKDISQMNADLSAARTGVLAGLGTHLAQVMPEGASRVSEARKWQPEGGSQIKRQNRHPIDRLADIRDLISGLKDEAEAIKEQILDGKIEPKGDIYEASITNRQSRSFNYVVAQKLLSEKMYKLLVKNSRHQQVTLRKSRSRHSPI